MLGDITRYNSYTVDFLLNAINECPRKMARSTSHNNSLSLHTIGNTHSNDVFEWPDKCFLKNWLKWTKRLTYL